MRDHLLIPTLRLFQKHYSDPIWLQTHVGPHLKLRPLQGRMLKNITLNYLLLGLFAHNLRNLVIQTRNFQGYGLGPLRWLRVVQDQIRAGF
jgi:hypothetical protein